MADTSPPSSRSVSPQPDDWQQSDISAADLSSWESERFQAHFGMSVLKEQVFLNGLRTTMWDDRSNADFEIRCGNKKFKIHKTIIRAHSDVLAKACDNRSFEASPSYPSQLARGLCLYEIRKRYQVSSISRRIPTMATLTTSVTETILR
ncbi:hypothetical protein D6C79_09566 [Aureobasidium pullulans]|nr:hypothetical protein D6C79_09566 [Aureobasidium pullulans]